MFDQVDQNNKQKFDKQKVKIDFITAIEALSKVSPSSEEVKHYNMIVIQNLKDFNSLPILLNLLIDSEGNNTKCSLVISFISYYLRAQSKPGVAVVRHNKKNIYQKIKVLFFCQSISHKHKRMLVHSFSQFISVLGYEYISLRKHLCQQIVDLFCKQKQQLTASFLVSCLYLIQAVVTKNLQTESLRLLLDKLLANFLRLSLKLTRQLDDLISSKDITSHFTLEENKKIQWMQRVIEIFQKLFMSATGDKTYVLKQNVIISTQFAHLCNVMLKISKNRNRLILNPQQHQSYEMINNMKETMLKMMVESFTFLQRAQWNLLLPKYIPCVETAKVIILEMAPMLCNQVNGYPHKIISNLGIYKETLLLLSKIIKFQCFQDQMTSIRDIALFGLCLPCFITTPADKQIDAEDYCNKKQKVMDVQNVITVSQAAARLVQSYADNTYGSMPYLVNALINLMDFQLTADPRYYQLIPPSLVETSFFKNHPLYDQIETGLSIVGLLSYHAQNRDDIVPAFEQFIVRRQQFFSRIDTSTQVIVSFLLCCAFYLQNFYQEILKGKVNADFHRSLIFHALQLLDASLDPERKIYRNNESKKIGIQAIDYVSNAMGQQFFFSALFPAWNQHSTPLLMKLIDKICKFFSYSCNYTILENVMIDFFTHFIDKHSKQGNNLAGMPVPLKKQLGPLIVGHVLINFKPDIKHENVAKQKMLQLYHLVLLASADPCQLLQMGQQLLKYIVQKQYSFIEQAIDLVQVVVKRAVKEQIVIPVNLHGIIGSCLTKAMKIVDNEKFTTVVFDAVLNANCLKIAQNEISVCLLQVFEQRLQQMPSDEEAQRIIQRTLYLLLQIAYSNFNSVRPDFWLNALDKFIEYIRQSYVSQQKQIIGKATCICLCCYIQQPSNVQAYLNSRMEEMWACALNDSPYFPTKTEQKIICILLSELMRQYSSKMTIKNMFPQMLKTVAHLLYSLYVKDETKMGDLSDESGSAQESSGDQQNGKKGKGKKKMAWKQDWNTMKSNPFDDNLPDEKAMFKKICVYLNENDSTNFQSFIKNLPIALQNVVKNKVMLYKQDSGASNKEKMRTIYKVKELSKQ